MLHRLWFVKPRDYIDDKNNNDNNDDDDDNDDDNSDKILKPLKLSNVFFFFFFQDNRVDRVGQHGSFSFGPFCLVADVADELENATLQLKSTNALPRSRVKNCKNY